jgi:hypothetical protein
MSQYKILEKLDGHGKFLMIQPGAGQVAPAQFNVVLNWFEEVKRLVPTH